MIVRIGEDDHDAVKAIVFERFGSPDVLELKEVAHSRAG